MMFWNCFQRSSHLHKTLTRLASAIEECSTTPVCRKVIIIYSTAILLAILATSGFVIGLSQFSPDSWAYFELTKSILEGDFYKFNTYRSYYSDIYSTSFPLGYPALLSAIQFITGIGAHAAVIVNVLAAAATWVTIIRLSEKLNLTPLAGLAIATSLIFFTPYLNEVHSGRSIPFAILLFLFAINAFISKYSFLSGLLLGFSVLVRFDYLLYSLLFMVALILLVRNRDNNTPIMILGFIVGMLPWISYSQIHFGKFWISDNSWVALSALPAFVVDFPAAPIISASDNPLLWIDRILSNIFPLARSIISSALRFPLILFLSLFLLLNIHCLDSKKRLHTALLLLLLCVSVAPYLLTGYFDSRYFSLVFVITSGIIIFLCESSILNISKLISFKILLIMSMVLSILTGWAYIAKQSLSGIINSEKFDAEEASILYLNECHSHQPDVTYIFTNNSIFAARYGAITGNRAAFIPSNYNRLTEELKEQFLKKMHPYAFISIPIETDKCP